jgi:hypothetical protein
MSAQVLMPGSAGEASVTIAAPNTRAMAAAYSAIDTA